MSFQAFVLAFCWLLLLGASLVQSRRAMQTGGLVYVAGRTLLGSLFLLVLAVREGLAPWFPWQQQLKSSLGEQIVVALFAIYLFADAFFSKLARYYKRSTEARIQDRIMRGPGRS